MEKLVSKYSLLMITAVTSMLLGVIAVAAQTIEIRIVEARDQESSVSDKRNHCEFRFEIGNNAWGTIDRLTVRLSAQDDRGRGIDGAFLGARVTNSQGSFVDRAPIPRGTSMIAYGEATFEEECRYISRVWIKEPVERDECAVRMMPEDGDCTSIIDFTSEIDGIHPE